MLAPLLFVTALSLDPAAAQRFADLALACVHQEYPNKLAHTLQSDKDVAPPRVLTPAFYGRAFRRCSQPHKPTQKRAWLP